MISKLNILSKADTRDRLEVEIGDLKQELFYPQVKFMRWDNEVNLSLRLIDSIVGTPDVAIDGAGVHWQIGNRRADFYTLPVSDKLPEGGFEFDVVLLSKPASNTLEFSIGAKDVQFLYQPPLTPQEIREGHERPEHVLGSYAVYSLTQKTNWSGGKLYRLGKMGHVYRPKVTDALGRQVWAELAIFGARLLVIIPQDFLDTAIYPVVVDPTFGYTTIGAQSLSVAGPRIDGQRTQNPGESGTADSITFYAKAAAAGSIAVTAALYDATQNLLSPQTAEGAINSTTAQWWTLNFTNGPSVSNANFDIACYREGSPAPNTVVYYDTGAPANQSGRVTAGLTYPTWPDPITWVGSSVNMSIYCTYTPTAAGQPIRKRMGGIPGMQGDRGGGWRF